MGPSIDSKHRSFSPFGRSRPDQQASDVVFKRTASTSLSESQSAQVTETNKGARKVALLAQLESKRRGDTNVDSF